MTQQFGHPLSGIRILDMTQFLSGPFCTQILADLGAEIIKLEAPQGDLARHIPPHFVGEDSVYYLSVNRNKQSLVVDMKRPAGLALVRQLMDQCDVVIENFRPGVLDRLGLSPSLVRKQRPELIWCAISGFGQTGPYREKPAYDMIVQALSGGMSLTGEPGRGAVRAGIPLGDLSAGMYAAIGILAALNRRTATGRGDVIDISMLDCQAAMLCYQAAYHLHSGEVPGRQGSGHDSIPTYRCFTAGDGVEVVITANTERMWQGLCRVLGLDHLVGDPRFASNRDRHANRLSLWPLLEAAFATRTADEWVPLLEAETIPVGVVNTLDRVMADPQIQAREMIQTLSMPDGRQVRIMADPLRFSECATVPGRFPSRLGQDGPQILSGLLNLTDHDIERLCADGVITVPKAA